MSVIIFKSPKLVCQQIVHQTTLNPIIKHTSPFMRIGRGRDVQTCVAARLEIFAFRTSVAGNA